MLHFAGLAVLELAAINFSLEAVIRVMKNGQERDMLARFTTHKTIVKK
jgi:hypothetical protein